MKLLRSRPRYNTTDHLIQESIKQMVFNSGLFWPVGAVKKKEIQTAMSMLILRSDFLCFHGQIFF